MALPRCLLWYVLTVCLAIWLSGSFASRQRLSDLSPALLSDLFSPSGTAPRRISLYACCDPGSRKRLSNYGHSPGVKVKRGAL